MIGELFSGTDTLPPELTASNLAKADDAAAAADWAAALVNTVLEVAGSHAALACRGFGVTNVVITGGISQTAFAKAVYDNFSRLYQLNYVIPAHSDYATAIGAARRAGYGA
jgi:type II pantothenate kinase